MRFSMTEQNPHSTTDEYGRAGEKNDYGENGQSMEFRPIDCEHHPIEEIQDTDKNKSAVRGQSSDGATKISALTRYLSLITVSIAALLTVGAAYFSSAVKVTVANELISFNSYSCTVELEESAEELTATLKSAGDELESVPIAKGQVSFELKFDGLLPERDYIITFTDKNGKEQYSKSFRTDPFVSFAAEADGKIAFTLHKSLTSPDSMMLDMGLFLYDSEGKDFSSNVIFDPEAESYIITEGLFTDSYSFNAAFYMPDAEEPTVYKKPLSAGTYEKPEFEIFISEITLSQLTLISGDISAYNLFEVEISNDEQYYRFYGEDVTFDGTVISVQITQAIASGDYTVYIWGIRDTDGIYLSNQIYKDSLTFTPAGGGSTDEGTLVPIT